ncbi:hypothetical protein KACC15558_33620 [Brevibacterium ammoniilyticum]|uniref:Uncharacterized protein n=1 Tax=Brevibacterium ammoniilyticum TaxID=1046555 RepID=A0ABP9UBL0_9MICO
MRSCGIFFATGAEVGAGAEFPDLSAAGVVGEPDAAAAEVDAAVADAGVAVAGAGVEESDVDESAADFEGSEDVMPPP